MLRSGDPPGWSALARFITYQAVNQPLRVARERLETLWDLYATGYAALWPRYDAAGPYYSPYDAVFSRWSADAIDGAAYSCPGLAQAQAQVYQRPAIRRRTAHTLLLWLHRAGSIDVALLLRPVMFLAPPLALFVFWRRGGDRTYAWLTAIIASSLLLRAMLVCADERYQLPVDILSVWWLALTLSAGARIAAGRRLSVVTASRELTRPQ